MRADRSKGQKGFTIPEVIASLVLLGVIAVFSYSFMFTSLEGFLFSTENSQAAGELKPMLDYLTTRMSDMEEVTCFSANSAVQFTDSHDQNYTVTLSGGDKVVINNWTIVDDVSNATFTMTDEDSHVKLFTLSFDYTLAEGNQATYSMQFSPRRYIPSSDITGCSS